MTKLGWFIIGFIVLIVAAFVSMTSFGGAARRAPDANSVAALADASGHLRVPVAGVKRSALVRNWGDARGGGSRAHHGLDIMAPSGTPVLAAASGTVEKLFQSGLGGTTVYVRSPDRRWTYYYAHLADYAPGLAEGGKVAAGQTIGYVGDTGDAGPGNYHLHFGTTRTDPAQRWYQGQDVDPYPMLAAGGAGG
ncbi:M23 family metallopeptidase [uncultured Sphingomonas sp.]|uniref:M23 family metallopeptidase n=1 Tax=uncultured Sphingomonas sp. TaxID=158754 RepID=UPI0035CA6202